MPFAKTKILKKMARKKNNFFSYSEIFEGEIVSTIKLLCVKKRRDEKFSLPRFNFLIF